MVCGLAGQCGGGSVGTPATILAKLGEESQLRPCYSHSQRGKGTERMSTVKTSDLCKVAWPGPFQNSFAKNEVDP